MVLWFYSTSESMHEMPQPALLPVERRDAEDVEGTRQQAKGIAGDRANLLHGDTKGVPGIYAG